MPSYTVLIPWKNETGDHSPGATVELSTDTPAQRVEVDKLINYGIVEVAPEKAPEPETKAAPSTSK